MNDFEIAFDAFRARFANCDWTTGNCYYFAVILQKRFGGGVCYDTIAGHFVLHRNGKYYDYNGEYVPLDTSAVIGWKEFRKYDELQYRRIVASCIL